MLTVTDMDVRVGVGCLVTVGMTFLGQLPGHQHEPAVLDPPFRHDMFSEMPHLARVAAQRGDFHAVLVIQVHMQGCQDEVVVLVESLGETPGQLPGLVVIHIDQGPN